MSWGRVLSAVHTCLVAAAVVADVVGAVVPVPPSNALSAVVSPVSIPPVLPTFTAGVAVVGPAVASSVSAM